MGIIKNYMTMPTHFFNTYRKRFVLLALLFFIFTPLPAYYIFKTLKFNFQSVEMQLFGIQYQRVIDTIFYDSLKYEILLHAQKVERLVHLNNEIQAQFRILKTIQARENQMKYVRLGYGFSIFKPMKIDPGMWQHIWNEIIQNPTKNGFRDFNQAVALQRRLVTAGYDHTVPHLVDLQLIKEATLSLLNSSSDSSQLIRQLKNTEWDSSKKYDIAFREFREMHPDILFLQGELQEMQRRYFEFLNQFLNLLDSPDKILKAALDFLNSSYQFHETILSVAQEILKREKKEYQKMFYILVLVLFIGIALILFYIFFRPLTGHMKKLQRHIEELSKGNVAPCFCSKEGDDFGDIGKNLDAVCQSISIISHELRDLGEKLTQAIKYVTYAAREQEFSAHGQEMQINDIERLSQEMKGYQHQIEERAKIRNKETELIFSLDHAKNMLDQLQSKMTKLVETSSHIIALLMHVEEKVNGMNALFEFMVKVSESAKLLSLNASIETANIINNKESFSAITQKIDRFAQKTAAATDDIHQIVDVMSNNMVLIKEEAVECLEEINAGAQQLIEVSHHLTRTAKQGHEQWERFEKFAHIIEKQIEMSQMMIQSILQLKKIAQDNTLMIKNLHQSLSELGMTADKLQETSTLFRGLLKC